MKVSKLLGRGKGLIIINRCVKSLVIKGLVNLNLGNGNRDQLERKEQREFGHVTSRVTTS